MAVLLDGVVLLPRPRRRARHRAAATASGRHCAGRERYGPRAGNHAAVELATTKTEAAAIVGAAVATAAGRIRRATSGRWRHRMWRPPTHDASDAPSMAIIWRDMAAVTCY